MMPLSYAKNHYGLILFSLVIFGSALDTSVGLNFLLLFVIVSGVVFSATNSGENIDLSSRYKLTIGLFFVTYIGLVCSEILTSFDPAEAASVIVNYLPVGLLGLVLVFCLKHGVSFSKLTPWIALIAIIYAIFALYQSNWRPSGRVSFGYNPIPLGMIAIQLMFWCGCATLERQRSSLLALVGIVAAFWVVYLTASRAPGIVGFALLSVWFLFSKQPLLVRAAVLISCASILPLFNFLGELAKSSEVSSLNILFEPANGSLLGRLSVVDSSIITGIDTGVSSSGTYRSWIWHTGIEVIKQQPWLGWGRETRLTQEMFRAVDAPAFLTTFPHFHNEIINMAVRFGIPAAILMIVSYASLFLIATNKRAFWITFVFLSQLFALSVTDVIWHHSVSMSMFVFTLILMFLFLIEDSERVEDASTR